MTIPQTDPDRCSLSWAAKVVCSGVYITGRDPHDVMRGSAGWMASGADERRAANAAHSPEPLAAGVTLEHDPASRTVRLSRDGKHGWARFFGPVGAVVLDGPDSGLHFQPVEVVSRPVAPDAAPWPQGEVVPEPPLARSALSAIDGAMDLLFAEPREMTNAVVVVHGGRIVAERYRVPYGVDTRFESWSMGKSIAATLIGLMHRAGEIDLDAPPGFPEWSGAGDPRAAIKLSDILRMSSGIAFTGSYGRGEDNAVRDVDGRYLDHIYVYAGAVDAHAFCAARPAEHPPGTVGRYRNCDPLLAMKLVRDRLAARGEVFATWPQRALFDRLGMRGMVLETDPYGNFLISGHDYGRARDWARLGLLHLRRGAWEGGQLLDPAFCDFVREPAPAHPAPFYGGFFYLNRSGIMPSLPADTYWASGGGFQRTLIVPSCDLVVVRLGHLSGQLFDPQKTLDTAVARMIGALAA